MKSRVQALAYFEQTSKQKGITVDRFNHALRFNLVVDVFKNENLVHYLPKNEYKRFNSIQECIEYANELLQTKECMFFVEEKRKKQKDGKISYKEFSQKKEEPFAIITFQEDHCMTKEDVSDGTDLYFLWCGDVVKIGKTKDFHKRINSMKTALHTDEYIAYVYKGKGVKEKQLQNLFQKYHKKGEWFHAHEVLARFCHVHFRKGIDYCVNDKKLKYPYYNKSRFSSELQWR